MGETRVDLEHLLEDLRDAYPYSIAETILTEIIANSLDSVASRITMTADPAQCPVPAICPVVYRPDALLRRHCHRRHRTPSQHGERQKGQRSGRGTIGNLPPYALALNPIEQLWAPLYARLRTAALRTVDAH